MAKALPPIPRKRAISTSTGYSSSILNSSMGSSSSSSLDSPSVSNRTARPPLLGQRKMRISNRGHIPARSRPPFAQRIQSQVPARATMPWSGLASRATQRGASPKKPGRPRLKLKPTSPTMTGLKGIRCQHGRECLAGIGKLEHELSIATQTFTAIRAESHRLALENYELEAQNHGLEEEIRYIREAYIGLGESKREAVKKEALIREVFDLVVSKMAEKATSPAAAYGMIRELVLKETEKDFLVRKLADDGSEAVTRYLEDLFTGEADL